MQALLNFFEIDTARELWWLVFGLAAQAMFFMRFFVQWISSERQRKSVMPRAFWWFSLGGGVMLLIYGFAQREPIIILGQAVGIVIYLRNIWFIYVAKS
ncbi:MAG: lipid-A-disaccharide synthase N-terminal domain-containing protein [Pseudomonadota bacterium]